MSFTVKHVKQPAPRDAITVSRELPDRNKLVSGEIEINENTCIYCGICDEMCPADAITMNNETIQDPEISVDKDKCVYCLICKRACQLMR